MNKNIKIAVIATLVVAVLGTGYYFFGPHAKNRTVVTNTNERIVNEELEFSFAFESGESALSSIESLPGQLDDARILKMYVLMEVMKLQDYRSDTEGKEPPPAITVLVFERTEADKLADDTATSTPYIDKMKNWAVANDQYTNINSASSEVEEVDIDGAPGIHYKVDGAYKQSIYLTKYQGRMYLFVGQYEEEGDYMNTSFQELVDSIYLE